MRYLLTITFFLSMLISSAQQTQEQQNELRSNMQIAVQYYNSGDYERAAPLLLKVYDQSKNISYFRMYLNSLIELQQFDTAENKIKSEIKKLRSVTPELYIHWGVILKANNKPADAEKKFNEALNMIPATTSGYYSAASAFMQWQEYDRAKKVYLQGRSRLAEHSFAFELARVYLYLRDYEMMMEEYLDILHHDEGQLQRIESTLSATLRIDIDNTLHNSFRAQVVKRVQAYPNTIGYSRLLIWFFLQEKQFGSALRQYIALDRRTEEEDAFIFQLGEMALNSNLYDDAKKAFTYLVDKGERRPLYIQATVQNTRASYMQYRSAETDNIDEGLKIADLFNSTLEIIGYSEHSIELIKDYAHLLAFYIDKTEEGVSILEEGLKIPRLKPEERGLLKSELADIYIYINDPWEATLLYSQVIDANKNNSLGDEVKLKKAQLGYYMGNFSWAKAQLDVLKASTSKLTANDAMQLSMLIGNNLNLDTTEVPLQMFARADLLFFRNQNGAAITTLDSITEMFPYHTLIEYILFRKAKIEIDNGNYLTAADYLQEITNDFSFGLLADNALFMLAELHENYLNQPEKARDLYKLMLTRHPGSIFIEESRIKYRELREKHPESNTDQEDATSYN